jgi:hypothetical protein
MNPKMTEFLAHDRIATFHAEVAGHRVEKRGAATGPKAPDAPAATRRLNGIAVVWYRIRRVGAG